MISLADEFAKHRSGAETCAIAGLIIGNSMARKCGWLDDKALLKPQSAGKLHRKRRRPVMGTVVKGRDQAMTTKIQFLQKAAAIGVAALLGAAPARLSAQQTPQSAVRVGEHDLGGVVTGKNGPEAGIWVIAETTGLPTAFAKIVVTDDQGRYVVPDLPKAKYKVWVRGYGLVDSAKVDGEPGKLVNLTAQAAPNEAAAAKYYPAIYW